jgi:hypothetical protein
MEKLRKTDSVIELSSTVKEAERTRNCSKEIDFEDIFHSQKEHSALSPNNMA